uniref:Disrupted DNA-binding transcriptional repressor n=1 Tax=Escherichia coli TaxID=562 RepID=A0A0S1TH32_ECOLX|nr:disrupted DNA-binding transcriptional repressor [Escherichia coli]
MARKTKQEAQERANTSSMWLYVFSHSRGYHPPRWVRLQKQLALRAVQSTGILKTSRICSVRSGNCQNPILVNSSLSIRQNSLAIHSQY